MGFISYNNNGGNLSNNNLDCWSELELQFNMSSGELGGGIGGGGNSISNRKQGIFRYENGPVLTYSYITPLEQTIYRIADLKELKGKVANVLGAVTNISSPKDAKIKTGDKKRKASLMIQDEKNMFVCSLK